jgi:ketosteroid isomerase-like protein
LLQRKASASYNAGKARGIMTKADEDAIREIELQFNEAWGRHDADGMVASLADDAQFITVNGAWTKNSR